MPLLTLVLATLLTAPSASQAQVEAASRGHLQELALALANSGSPRDRALHSQMVWLNAAGTDLICDNAAEFTQPRRFPGTCSDLENN